MLGNCPPFCAINDPKVYAALIVEGIKEIEEENLAARAEANESSDGRGMLPLDGDQEEYMGWIIDDFPGTAQQVFP